MSRKRRHTQGLDQIGPTRPRLVMIQQDMPSWLGYRHSISARVLSSARHRKVKITLSDHLFSSDEIKTKDDT